MSRTGRIWHAVLWLLEVLAIVLVVLLLTIPTLDYARREYMRWYLHPSAENLQALRAKEREEILVRVGMATPIAAVAVLLALHLRSKSRKPG